MWKRQEIQTLLRKLLSRIRRNFFANRQAVDMVIDTGRVRILQSDRRAVG